MLRVPLNKGDLYESHVAGLHQHDNFRGGQNGCNLFCTISGRERNDGILLLYRTTKDVFEIFGGRNCSVAPPLVAGLPRCPSSGTDKFYLQFQPTIWALNYPRKHNQLHHFASRTWSSDTTTSYRKTSVLLKLSNVTFVESFTSTTKI